MGVGLFVGAWIARHLGPSQFGILSFASVFVTLFSAIATLGLRGIVVRTLLQDQSRTSETLKAAFVLQVFGGTIAYCLAITAILFLRPDEPQVTVLVSIIGITLLTKSSETLECWFEARLQSKYIVLAQNISFATWSIAKLILLSINAPLLHFAWAIIGEALLAAALLLRAYLPRGPNFIRTPAPIGHAKGLLLASWPLFLSGLTVTLYMKIDQVMLGQLIGNQSVGVYSAATRISEVWYFIPTAIAASVFPAIIEAKNKDHKLYLKRMQHLYDLMVVISVAIAVPMSFASTPIVEFVFGPPYREAGPILAIHIWAAIFVFIGVASSKWLLAENLQLSSFHRTAVGALVNVALNFILIPDHGGIGAAWATVIAYAVAALGVDAVQAKTRTAFFMKLRAFNPLGIISRFRTFTSFPSR